MEILRKIGGWFKRVFKNLLHRVKPRKNFRWIFSTVVWLIIIAYIGVGVYAGINVYHSKKEDKFTKVAVKIYPFPVAVVNGSIVWANEYYQQLNFINQFTSKTQQPIADIPALRKQIIDQLIENKLLETQAQKYRVKVTTKDVNDAYDKIVTQSGGVSEVKKVLNEMYGMTEKEFKELVRQQVLKEKIQNEVITQVKVKHILIKDEARANEIAGRAKKGDDFVALAKEFSEDTKSRDAGGDLGWLARGQLVIDNNAIPEFDEAAFNAKVGEVVGPIKTANGFEILVVDEKKGQINENFTTWIGEIKSKAKIWVFIK